MVSIPESDDDRKLRSIASPSFQNLLDCEESSDYETDLEEDFPGTMTVTVINISCEHCFADITLLFFLIMKRPWLKSIWYKN